MAAATGVVVAGNNGTSSGVAVAAAGPEPKNLGFMGARRRQGRWASELRMPRTRTRLWIGTFGSPEEAALAYDAAIFCFYGARIPRSRRFNFPNAPRPNIPEHIRLGLTVSNIRAIAGNYARKLAVYFAPPPPPAQVAEAAPAPASLMVEAVDSAAAANAGADAGAVATTATDDQGDMNAMDFDATFEDYFLSFSPDEFDNMMAGI